MRHLSKESGFIPLIGFVVYLLILLSIPASMFLVKKYFSGTLETKQVDQEIEANLEETITANGPSGRLYYWTSKNKSINIIDFNNKLQKQYLKSPNCDPLEGVSISPDEKKIICGSNSYSRPSFLIDTTTGKILQSIPLDFKDDDEGYSTESLKALKSDTCGFLPTWSKDSKYILALQIKREDPKVYSNCDFGNKLIRINTETFSTEELLDITKLEGQFNQDEIIGAIYSPDGEKIMITTAELKYSEVNHNYYHVGYKAWLTDKNGANPKIILDNESISIGGDVRWLKDSNKIIYKKSLESGYTVLNLETQEKISAKNAEISPFFTVKNYQGDEDIYYYDQGSLNVEGRSSYTHLKSRSLITDEETYLKDLSDKGLIYSFVISPDKKYISYSKPNIFSNIDVTKEGTSQLLVVGIYDDYTNVLYKGGIVKNSYGEEDLERIEVIDWR